MADRPNLLYIHSHDTGRCIQPYGHGARTPRLQRLAEEGVLFRQAFCAAPTCSPSRAALLTGQWPHASGMLGLAHRGWSLAEPRRHLAHVLREAGYRTVLAGIQHVTREPADTGYSEILRGGRGFAERAAAWLDAAPAGPFFLDAGFFETHREFPPPAADAPDTDPRFVRPPAPLPDTPATRADAAAFNTMARTLDAQIGVVLDALDRSGRADNTLVVCTTDHGPAFPAMKCNLTDHGIGVLLILRGPGAFRGGRTVDALVSHVDLFPTVCEATGTAAPPWLDGRALQPLLDGRAGAVREDLFAEVTYHAAYEPMRAVRTTRHKYIRRFDGALGVVRPNCDDSPSKTLWHDRGWADRPHPPEALFDLTLDPNETDNRIGDPALAAVAADLRTRLDRWMQETGDPLLKGPVPPPAGAQLNNAAGFSPGDPMRQCAGTLDDLLW